jgi:peptidoglycan/xylan/chitin deacetylase (PgdA/CDA1 family)
VPPADIAPRAPLRMPGGGFVVSLDFEQYWGVRDRVTLAEYRSHLLGARDAVPAMLEMFAEFGVRATWAVVGLLFAEDRREMLARLPARRPRYRDPALSPYGEFGDVGENEREDPFHFAPSLIRRIAASPGQEVGTHTFAHYYCLEDGASPEDLRADLVAALEVSRDKLGQTPRSIVFPRNQFDTASLAVCEELGLAAYRGNPVGWAYGPRRHADESNVRRAVRLLDSYAPLTGSHAARIEPPRGGALVNVAASRYLRAYTPVLRHLEGLRLRRITEEMRGAAEAGLVFHLWSHPQDLGGHVRENLAFLRRILVCFRDLRDRLGMESLTMGEAGERARAWRAASAAVEVEEGTLAAVATGGGVTWSSSGP